MRRTAPAPDRVDAVRIEIEVGVPPADAFEVFTSEIGQWWHLNRAIIDQMRADCAAADVDLLFLYVPTVRWREFPMLERHLESVGAGFIDLRGSGVSRRS